MSIRIQQAPVHTMIAPSRLVSRFALRSGYDMGVAATATQIEFELPAFELDDGKLDIVERGINTVTEAYEAYHWREPTTPKKRRELQDYNTPPTRVLAHLFREQRMRIEKLRAAVAKGDHELAELAKHGLVLIVTTVKAGDAGEYPFRAVVRVERLANRTGLHTASPKAA